MGDSITGDESVDPEFSTDLTIETNPSLVSSGSHEQSIETLLSRMIPVVSDAATLCQSRNAVREKIGPMPPIRVPPHIPSKNQFQHPFLEQSVGTRRT